MQRKLYWKVFRAKYLSTYCHARLSVRACDVKIKYGTVQHVRVVVVTCYPTKIDHFPITQNRILVSWMQKIPLMIKKICWNDDVDVSSMRRYYTGHFPIKNHALCGGVIKNHAKYKPVGDGGEISANSMNEIKVG
ncbi:hypothetical protein GWI33_005127 [Rhynchophorus ferrugineus]|uniref:Uncharacterized protein n=1 Tax=Rhynchophorus ferrugineus TaxID=354439 RepID=A0A834IU85_RHYFE|nr:hypothetical protein GWI33_005127 [Rhynchophorus ferrugineus]